MFPLKVVLAGCDDRLLPHVRRELLNQSIDLEAEYPDMDRLVQALRPTADEQRLYVVQVRGADDVRMLKRVSGTFVGKPVLALMDDGQSVSVILGAMRAGAAQVVPLPLQPADFKAALDCIGLQYGYSPVRSRVIVVSGVTGGCGATTLAVNLAYELAHCQGMQAILMEPAAQMGMLVTYLDVEPKYTLSDLLKYSNDLDVHVLETALTKVTERFSILAGPSRATAAKEGTQALTTRIIDYARRLADVVVLDVPCTFDDAYFEMLADANQVVLVGEQRIPSIRNLQLVLDALGKGDVNRKHFVVLNRYDPNLQGFTISELEKHLHLPRVATLTNDWQTVNTALNHGRPLLLQAPNAPIVADIRALGRLLLGGEDAAAQATDSSTSKMFGRLFQSLGLSSS